MFVVETLPLAVAIGYNHSGQAKFKMVNICLIPSKKTLILYCPMFYVPCLCAFFPCPLVLCVPCPVWFLSMSLGPICLVCPMSCVLSSHVLWSHMSCMCHVLCLTMSYDCTYLQNRLRQLITCGQNLTMPKGVIGW